MHLLQYYQWIRSPPQRGAQGIPAKGAAASPQGEVPERLPPPACLLCGAVPRKRPFSY